MQLQCNYFCEAWAPRSVSSLNLLYAHACFSFLSLSLVNFRVAAVVQILRPLIPSGKTFCSSRNLKKTTMFSPLFTAGCKQKTLMFQSMFFWSRRRPPGKAFARYVALCDITKGRHPRLSVRAMSKGAKRKTFPFCSAHWQNTFLLLESILPHPAPLKKMCLRRTPTFSQFELRDGKLLVAPNLPPRLFVSALASRKWLEERYKSAKGWTFVLYSEFSDSSERRWLKTVVEAILSNRYCFVFVLFFAACFCSVSICCIKQYLS